MINHHIFMSIVGVGLIVLFGEVIVAWLGNRACMIIITPCICRRLLRMDRWWISLLGYGTCVLSRAFTCSFTSEINTQMYH